MNVFESIPPDAINTLESKGVKRALPRYRNILLGKEKAKFVIARENSIIEISKAAGALLLEEELKSIVPKKFRTKFCPAVSDIFSLDKIPS